MIPSNAPELVAQLEADPTLGSMFVAPPQIVSLPDATQPDIEFMVVVLFLSADGLDRAVMAQAITRSVEILRLLNSFDHLSGVEVIPCVVVGARTERLLRFSARIGALDSIQGLTADQISERSEAELTCHIYPVGRTLLGLGE